MNISHVDAIVRAVLYEGYILYPYRASSVKNRQRWTFGGVYPRGYTEIDASSPCHMQTEILVSGNGETEFDIHVRFLHLVRREVGELGEPLADLPREREPDFTLTARLTIGERQFQPWEEVVERDIELPALAMSALADETVTVPFEFKGTRELEGLRGEDGRICGALIRTSATVSGEVTLSAAEVFPGVYRVTVHIENLTPFDGEHDNARERAQARAFTSTHTLIGVRGGELVSLLDPPENLKHAATACDNQGTWPVLAGPEGSTDTMLSSPIILYDYPEIAPESPGDLFDATEIDEILTLRILTMTGAEKREMIATDERAKELLERTENLTAEDMARMHGTMRNPRYEAEQATLEPPTGMSKPELAALNSGGVDLRVGSRVRLNPKPGGDVIDLVLKDEIAIIEAIERDFEDRIHVAVVIENDPGREFGIDRMPGHRFFYSPEEIEPVGEEEAA